MTRKTRPLPARASSTACEKEPRLFARLAATTAALSLGAALMSAPLAAQEDTAGLNGYGTQKKDFFERIATFPVILNEGDPTADNEVRLRTPVAEIVDYFKDDGGLKLIYTDSEREQAGFVDLSDPANPAPNGLIPLGGEPTSVAVAGDYGLVAVNTSADFIDTSGHLAVIDLVGRSIVTEIDLGGQPDSVAVSPDGRYAAVAIENERDEDLGSGEPPQLPAGYLVIVDLVGAPADWTTRTVDLTGLADYAPEDPEPEYVDINARNIAAVTLQENNHIVLVSLADGKVTRHFSAGTAKVRKVDIEENDLIQLKGTIDVPREPDAITWMGNWRMATADEGDLFGGSRGFTVFNTRGTTTFKAGNSFEHLTVRHGHYPEDRSENKGAEPEGAEYAVFGEQGYLFIAAERAGVIGVYETKGAGAPQFLQFLPTGAIGPEGLKAIPEEGLLVVAQEVDVTADELEDDANPLAGFRAGISVYRLDAAQPSYPKIISANRTGRNVFERFSERGSPIPWAALSALATGRSTAQGFEFYSVHDSFFNRSRIYRLTMAPRFPDIPAVLLDEIVLKDRNGDFDFSGDGDGFFDFDLEGLAVRANGGFWAVSEGRLDVGGDREFNRLIKVAPNGKVQDVVELPAATQALQIRFGFEGVAVVGSGDAETVYVAFQREWTGDPDGMVRIGRYTPVDGAWAFFYYPLDVPTPVAPGGPEGWVGLSEIVALDDESFAVVERDNRIGLEAAIKQICSFSVAGLTPAAEGGAFPILTKSDNCFDLIPALQAENGTVLDKVEGMMIGPDNQVYIATDNDGVDDSPGETQLIKLGDAESVIPAVPAAPM